MTKHVVRIVTIALALILASLLGVGMAMASRAAANGNDPAAKRPDMPGRTLTIPRRPCADQQDYNWCYWDAQRNQAFLDDQGNPFVGGTHSYWAYTTASPVADTQRVCITYLNWRYNKQHGGCALQSLPN